MPPAAIFTLSVLDFAVTIIIKHSMNDLSLLTYDNSNLTFDPPAILITPFAPCTKLFGSWIRANTISSSQSGHMAKLA